MKKDENISEEQLNAFVDGELEAEERSCLFDEAERSEEIDKRVCQQRKLKELVKHAYHDVPEPKRPPMGGVQTSLARLSVAASVVLLLGVLSGVFIHDALDRSRQPEAGLVENGLQAATSEENYILHAISGDPEQMKRVLDTAASLLSSADTDSPRQIEVVANERGINLLREDITPFGNEIAALADKNVLFYACSKSIQRLESNGIEVRLVPEAKSGYTALDRVVIRMKDGWQYMKI